MALTLEQQRAIAIAEAEAAADEEAAAAAATPPPSSQMQQGLSQLSALTQNPAVKATADQRTVDEYNAMPGWKRAAVTAIDLPSLIAQGGSVGLLDKAAAAARAPFTDKTYDEELRENRRQTEEARARQGWAGTAAEVAGAIGSGSLLTKGAIKGLTKVAPAVATTRVGAAFAPVVAGAPKAPLATRVANTGIRTALGVGEGSAYGATNAFGADEDIGTGAALGGLFGGVAGPAAKLITGGVSKVAGAFNKKWATPTLEKLNAVKNLAYDAAEQAGVSIKPEGLKHLADTMMADIDDFGFDPEVHKGAKILVDKIWREQGKTLTLKELDAIRKRAGNVGYIPGDKPNNAVVAKIVKHIDDLLENADPAHMAGIDTEAGVKALKIGRDFARRGFKLDTAQKLLKRAEGQSESNITDTTVRSAKKQLSKINDPFMQWGRGFTEAEKAAAAKAAKYTFPQRAMHNLSAMNPFAGGKLNAMAGLAALGPNAFFLGLPGLALQAGAGVGGYAAGKYGEHLAKKSVNEFLDIVARGGVPAPQVENAVQKMAKSKQDAVRRALMLGMNNQYNQPAER
jgi:hypothetical protein